MKYLLVIVFLISIVLPSCKSEGKDDISNSDKSRDLEYLMKQNEKYDNYKKENQKRLEEIKSIRKECVNKYIRNNDSLLRVLEVVND